MTSTPQHALRRDLRPLLVTVGITIAIVVVASALAWYRLPPIVRDTSWAEDARVFMRERYQYGILGTQWRVYGGYLQFSVRILTDIATTIAPLERFATTVTALTCAVAGGIAGLVYLLSRDVIATRAARILLAFITVLVPAIPVEVLGNMANIHWLFLWLSPWLLLFKPSRWWQSLVVAVIMLIAALTEIQVAYFLPLVLFSIRRRKAWPVSAALVVGVAAQFYATTTVHRNAYSHVHLTILDIVKGYFAEVVQATWTPSSVAIAHYLTTYGWKVVVLGGVPFAAAAVYLLVRSRRWEFLVVGTAIWGAVVPWVAAAKINAQGAFQFDHFTAEQLMHPPFLRYAVVPSMFLLAIVVIAADRLLRTHRRIPVIVGAVLLALVLALQLRHFDVKKFNRDQGPVFSVEMEKAYGECQAGASDVTLPGSPPIFPVELPCAVVLEHAH